MTMSVRVAASLILSLVVASPSVEAQERSIEPTGPFETVQTRPPATARPASPSPSPQYVAPKSGYIRDPDKDNALGKRPPSAIPRKLFD